MDGLRGGQAEWGWFCEEAQGAGTPGIWPWEGAYAGFRAWWEAPGTWGGEGGSAG